MKHDFPRASKSAVEQARVGSVKNGSYETLLHGEWEYLGCARPEQVTELPLA